MDEIRLKSELVHKAEWERRKRLEEKMVLQTALDQCQQALYLEREKFWILSESATRCSSIKNRISEKFLIF